MSVALRLWRRPGALRESRLRGPPGIAYVETSRLSLLPNCPIRSSIVFRFGYSFLEDLPVLVRQLLFPEFYRQLGNLAGEAERHLIVLVVDRGASVDSNVEGLVYRHEERNRVRNFLVGDFLVVHFEDAGAALAGAGSVVREVKHDGVFSRRERL